MLLPDLLKIKFPTANLAFDIVLQDDGQGPYIAEWNIPDPQPSEEDLVAWAVDPLILAAYKKIQDDIVNKPIYAQLDALDIKSIRAIRTNDVARMAQYEQEAVALRAQLVK